MEPNQPKINIENELTELLKVLLVDGQNPSDLRDLVDEVINERDSFWRKQLILAAIIDYLFEHLSEMNRLQGDIHNLKEKIIVAVNDEYSKMSMEELQTILRH